MVSIDELDLGEYCLWQQSWMLGWFQELRPSSAEHTPLLQGTVRVKAPKFRLVRMRLKRHIIARNMVRIKVVGVGSNSSLGSKTTRYPHSGLILIQQMWVVTGSQGDVSGNENRTLTLSLGMWLNWFPVLIVFLGIQLFPPAFWVRMGLNGGEWGLDATNRFVYKLYERKPSLWISQEN